MKSNKSKVLTLIFSVVCVIAVAWAIYATVLLVKQSAKKVNYNELDITRETVLKEVSSAEDDTSNIVSCSATDESTETITETDTESVVATEPEPKTTEEITTIPKETEPETTKKKETKPAETTKKPKTKMKTVYLKVDRPVSGRRYVIVYGGDKPGKHPITRLLDYNPVEGSGRDESVNKIDITVNPGLETTNFVPFIDTVVDDDCLWVYNKGTLKNVKLDKYLFNGSTFGVEDGGKIICSDGGYLVYYSGWKSDRRVTMGQYTYFYEQTEIEY